MDARDAGGETNRPSNCMEAPREEKESCNRRISNVAMLPGQRMRG